MFVFLTMAIALASAPATASCPAPGQWITPEGAERGVDELFSELADSKVVLLGEQHARWEHQRWQLHTLAGLHARRPDMVIALEMLPRQAQPALNAWVAGELDEATFLKRSDWRGSWGHDYEAYMPILHFARMHRVPVLAVNIDRALHSRLTVEGWDAVSEGQRYRITAPVPAPDAYRARLRAVYAAHPSASHADHHFERFIAGQLVWDRVLAAGLAEAASDGALVVGLMGRGHVEYGHGVPHQLADLGITDSRMLLPWDANEDCRTLQEGVAHAVFGIAAGEQHEPPRPTLLGVFIEASEAGVLVLDIASDSVAERAGLESGDVITHAAGQRLRETGDLVSLVRRQMPGTVLPLTVLRDERETEILARFPVHSD
ncbi:PDZ/DHR/GLGF protein [Thioalkalivibrio denitrificans]|uniref:PDZ/DHR/GLGF protein n=1 Tax=Thioalkalivibrio denitrificans TaxID=108003 RepID=A0A1V3NN16_9GAMM|nr:PDZ/DHR/GLGF protein [Thioalkalivibrio denitrificans]